MPMEGYQKLHAIPATGSRQYWQLLMQLPQACCQHATWAQPAASLSDHALLKPHCAVGVS